MQDSPKDALKDLSRYTKDLWVRLNGGTTTVGMLNAPRGLPLPQPAVTKEDWEKHLAQLAFDIGETEKGLNEASKAREARLRSVGFKDRARVVKELRERDDAVMTISRQLAVQGLHLELEYIYNYLEEEAMDVASREGVTIGGYVVSPLLLLPAAHCIDVVLCIL